MTGPESIDAYINAAPEAAQHHLREIRALIREMVPEATEAISYGLATFKLNGKNLVHFGAFKAHIGFYPTPTGLAEFQSELSRYKGGKGSVQFPMENPMPLDLVRKITEFRIKALSSKPAPRKKAR